VTIQDQLRLVVPRGLIPRDRRATELYGLHREDEGVIQVLSRYQRRGLQRVGHSHLGSPCNTGLCFTHAGAFISGQRHSVSYVAPVSSVATRNGGGLDLSRTHAVLIGVGSVGSALALALAQAGIGRLTLIDPDVVDTPNLSRTLYRLEDLGRYKVHALAERVAGVGSSVDVDALAQPFDAPPVCDLIVASTDDAGAQLQSNRAAVGSRTPALFAGCHVGAESGEVLWFQPGTTACYACTFDRMRGIGPRLRTTPYRAGRRPRPELGLAIDVQRVTSVALAFAMALLEDPARQGLLSDPARNLVLLQSGRTPNRRSKRMQLPTPFSTCLPRNPRDPGCSHCGEEGERFIDVQRAAVRSTAGM
jgi:hypothetical protein